jgi:putative transposase
MNLRTFKYRLYPTAAQERQLRLCLDAARNWYNMCVAERKYAWELEGRRVSKNDQLRLVKHYKAAFRRFKDVHSHILQVATTQCDEAFQHFFRRVKAGQTPGYPRFKGYNHFQSFGLKEYGNGFRLDRKRLSVTAVGRLRVRWHRRLEGQIKTARFLQQAGKWFVCFTCALPDPTPLTMRHKAVGIDLNVENLLHDSDNRRIESPKHYRESQCDLRIAQRGLQRKQRGGKNWRNALLRVQRLHEYIRNQRQDLLNKQAHYYSQHYDLIGIEDLQITNMVRNKHLSKSILDQGWGYFKKRLVAKAANAGRQLVLVNPAYTSQRSFCCDVPFPEFKTKNDPLANLSVRQVTCPRCGRSLARDHNAALNILKRATIGRVTTVQLNVGARTAMRAVEATRSIP